MQDQSQPAKFAEMVASDKVFEDDKFPADLSSCFWPDDKTAVQGDPSSRSFGQGNSTDVIKMYTDRIEGFKRPSEMIEGEPNLWGKKGILPVGVRQGSLGDCWLLAACSALAEKPERVRRVFGN
jgi:hypothetical protein